MLIQSQMLQGQRGEILENGQLMLTGEEIDPAEANTQVDNIQLTTNNLNHNQGTLAQLGEQPEAIQVVQKLANQTEDICTNGSFLIKANQLDN
ncbi:MAG TPA: hypothetical protein ACHBX0_02100 [Arsenophonus sp.]